MKWADLRVRTSARVNRGEVWLHPADHRLIYTPRKLLADVAEAKRLPDAVRSPRLRAQRREESDQRARDRIQIQMAQLFRKEKVLEHEQAKPPCTRPAGEQESYDDG